MTDTSIQARLLRAVLAALAILAMAAAVLAIVPAAATPLPSPRLYYGLPVPVPPFLGDPFAPTPAPAPAPPSFARACDGSEPIFGGILGAAAGGLLAAALSEHHGQADPGATVFGVVTGAMVGATLAASHCTTD
jgi:hypothetical protein